jgi:signal transduction histidine kinase
MKTINFALQRKLFEQQRVAHLIEINRSKDEFISIASHQLRTPATGVKQYVGMLREGFAGELSPQQKLLVEKAYESNERQLTIVADLLRVARVDAGKVTLHREMTDLNRAVRDVVDELRSELRTRHITVRITPNTPVEAMVDQETMRMVLDNLIENAVKYSEDESEIHITLRTDSAATTLSVSDSGVGVEPEHIDELFEKFRRIPNVRSTKVGGTGLGLYWAQKIIQLHGGMITYQRRQPQGSTFRIELPHQQEVTKE